MAGSQEKTEKPTSKKLSDARKKGQIAKSAELSGTAVLLVGGAVAVMSTRFIADEFKRFLHDIWGQGFQPDSMLDSGLAYRTMIRFLVMVAPLVLSTFAAAIAVGLMQTKGGIWSFESIRPDFSKLNPANGFKKLFSSRSIVELIKSVIKVLAISFTVYTVISSEGPLIMNLSDVEPSEMAAVFGSLVFKVLIRAGGVMLIMSLGDFYYQRWQYLRDLRMTKQEIKEEHKHTDGNPQIKSRIRSIQRSILRQRMMTHVPKASVVITNPTHFAVAILYTPQMEAPKVVAKGVDFLAKNIIKVAREHGVPVFQNPPLARALYHQVKLEETIPVTLYKAVAKVLAYIFQQKGRRLQ